MKRLLILALLLMTTLSGAVQGRASTSGIRFRFGKSAVDSSYLRNAAALEAIASSLDGKDPAALSYIQIRVASSPDGPEAVNRRIARERGNNMKEWLRTRFPSVPDSLIRLVVVPEDWDGVLRYVRRSEQPWQQEALAILQSGGADREERLKDLWVGEAWDELMRRSFPSLRRADVRFVFRETAAALPSPGPSVSGCSADGVPVVSFAVGKTAVDRTLSGNEAALAVAAALQGTVYLDSYASPEGKTSYNNLLSERRAASVRAALLAAGVPADRIQVRSQGEDWAGLRASVVSDYQGSDREEVLWILDDEALSVEARKSALRALDGGRTWSRLIRSQMPGLRRVCIRTDASNAALAPAVDTLRSVVAAQADSLARPDSLSASDSVASPVDAVAFSGTSIVAGARCDISLRIGFPAAVPCYGTKEAFLRGLSIPVLPLQSPFRVAVAAFSAGFDLLRISPVLCALRLV